MRCNRIRNQIRKPTRPSISRKPNSQATKNKIVKESLLPVSMSASTFSKKTNLGLRNINRKGSVFNWAEIRATELAVTPRLFHVFFIFLSHSRFTVDLFKARLIFLFGYGEGNSRPPPVSNCPSQARSLSRRSSASVFWKAGH